MAAHSLRVIKKDFRAFICLVREAGVWVMFSSIVTVEGGNMGRNGQTESMAPQLVSLSKFWGF